MTAIRALALECLLEDQIRTEGEHYGSWGRSTLDYCYLTTDEPRWTPGRGSITQTSWALLGLLGSTGLSPEQVPRIEAAAHRADNYVSKFVLSFLQNPERDRNNEARNRHAATALLADLLLTQLLPERRERDVEPVFLWEKYTNLLADLARYLEQHGRARNSKGLSTEAVLVALYPLLVRTLLDHNGSNDVGDALLRNLVEVWRAQALDVVTSAADLLTRFDPRKPTVISKPHVWAALLDVTSIVAQSKDNIAVRAETLRSEIEQDAAIALSSIACSTLPIWRDGSLWEHWAMLALLLQLGPDYSSWANEIAEHILLTLDTERSTNKTRPVLGGCTHIWSILSRHAGQPTDVLYSSMDRSVIQDLIATRKFHYRHWPRKGTVPLARDLRAFEITEAWIRGSNEDTLSLSSRFAALYRADIATANLLVRRKGSRCRSILLAGYTTAGKSMAAEFLEINAGLGRLIKRITTAKWNPGEQWEKHYYKVTDETEFDAQRGKMFGVHSLKGARFGFLTLDFLDVPESLFRILPVGWSQEAILKVKEFCNQHGEDPLVLALKPSEQLLEFRLRQRWGPEDLSRQLTEAENFYDCLSSDVIVIDSSGPKEEMFCALFTHLRQALALSEGWDVALSYAGPQLAIAEDIRAALNTIGIRAFVAGADMIPSLDHTAQENIDRVFELVDVILVIWSSDYPKREFASHEWVTWVSGSTLQNQKEILFVTTDGTPLPPEARAVEYLSWANAGASRIANTVRQRLERINRLT